MSVIMFSAEDSFYIRKALFRMIISRAERFLQDPADTEELTMSELTEGISLFRLPDDQRARLSVALLAGIEDLRADVAAGKPTEEPVRDGAEDLLDELVDYMNAHLSK